MQPGIESNATEKQIPTLSPNPPSSVGTQGTTAELQGRKVVKRQPDYRAGALLLNGLKQCCVMPSVVVFTSAAVVGTTLTSFSPTFKVVAIGAEILGGYFIYKNVT